MLRIKQSTYVAGAVRCTPPPRSCSSLTFWTIITVAYLERGFCSSLAWVGVGGVVVFLSLLCTEILTTTTRSRRYCLNYSLNYRIRATIQITRVIGTVHHKLIINKLMQENMIIIFLTFTGAVLYLLMANKLINALRTVTYLAIFSG